MKRLIAISLVASLIATSAFACGPGMTGPGTNTGLGGGDNTRRQRWVKKRVEHLQQQNQDYRALRARAKIDRAIGPFGGSDSSEFEAIQKQHRREQVELMMLKKELGDISPSELAALKQFLTKRRANVVKGGRPVNHP